MKSIKMSDYFKIVHPKYIIYQVIPDTSIRNYDSTNVAKSISHLYVNALDSIKKVENKMQWIKTTPVKCSYLIDVTKTDVSFYFIVPEIHKATIKDKIQETWHKVEIKEVPEIKEFSQDALKYQMNFKKEDALSLAVDKRSNEPLNSIFNVIDIMQDKDRVGIFYNFIPCHQHPFKKEYSDTMIKIKENKPIDREKFNTKYIALMAGTIIIKLLDDLKDVFVEMTGGSSNIGKNIEKNLRLLEVATDLMNSSKKLSTQTLKKKDAVILNTQILILSESNDKTRQSNNAIAVCQDYKSTEETQDMGNQLVYKRVASKNNFYVKDLQIAGVETNRVSSEECQNFIQLPARELLDRYKITKIDTLQTAVPKQLRTGIMDLGNVTHKGLMEHAYLSHDKELQYLVLCLVAPTRAGKTTLIGNLASDGLRAGECDVNFDFCGNCESSDEISLGHKNVLNIDCSNPEIMQGLGYNEIEPKDDSVFEIYRCAKAKTSQLTTLVNSLAEDELKDRMERYFECASLIVFIQGGSIKDVFKILQDYKLREEYISKVPSNQLENLDEYIISLQEIDEWTKKTKDAEAEIIGTKISFVQGILNRVSKLKANTFMELMLKKSCENNINLVEEIQKNQLICIRIPEIMFQTESEKDIYCTYWLTKLWGALQVRKWNTPKAEDRTKVNIFIDELSQVPKCQLFLKTKLSQIAKFSAKPIISCHYLGQIVNIRAELKSANASYILIQGCDKQNFRELKEELEPYQLEDLLKLKRYQALCLIKYEEGWAKFITQLPLPLK